VATFPGPPQPALYGTQMLFAFFLFVAAMSVWGNDPHPFLNALVWFFVLMLALWLKPDTEDDK